MSSGVKLKDAATTDAEKFSENEAHEYATAAFDAIADPLCENVFLMKCHYKGKATTCIAVLSLESDIAGEEIVKGIIPLFVWVDGEIEADMTDHENRPFVYAEAVH